MSAELVKESRRVTAGLRRVRIQLESGVHQSSELTDMLQNDSTLIGATHEMHSGTLKVALSSNSKHLDRVKNATRRERRNLFLSLSFFTCVVTFIIARRLRLLTYMPSVGDIVIWTFKRVSEGVSKPEGTIIAPTDLQREIAELELQLLEIQQQEAQLEGDASLTRDSVYQELELDVSGNEIPSLESHQIVDAIEESEITQDEEGAAILEEEQAAAECIEEKAAVESVEEKAAVEYIEEKAAVDSIEEKAAVESVEEKAAVESIEEKAAVESFEARGELLEAPEQASPEELADVSNDAVPNDEAEQEPAAVLDEEVESVHSHPSDIVAEASVEETVLSSSTRNVLEVAPTEGDVQPPAPLTASAEEEAAAPEGEATTEEIEAAP